MSEHDKHRGFWETCPRCQDGWVEHECEAFDANTGRYYPTTTWKPCDNPTCVNGKVWEKYEPDLVFDGSNDEDVLRELKIIS